MPEYALVKGGIILEFRFLAPGDRAIIGTHPTKPFLLPVVLVDPAFNPVTQVRDGPVHTVEAARVLRTFIVRAKDPGEVQAMKDAKINIIRTLGTEKLAAQLPLAKQVNALTRLVQLMYANTVRTGWPANHQTLATMFLNQVANIQNIRTVEDTKVAEVTALTTPAQIDAYNVQAGW